MTTIDVDPNTPLKVGDFIDTGSVFGPTITYNVINVVSEGVYEIRAEGADEPKYIRRARHALGVETGIFVYVNRNKNGRWVREETGPAYYWACHPRRTIQQK